MKIWILVGAGGALGSMARYGLTAFASRYLPPTFPYGTFIVNIAGCLVFGLVVSLAGDRVAIGTAGRAFFLIGVLGGFTTFSSFMLDTFTLAEGHQTAAAFLNVAVQIFFGYAAAYVGFRAAA